MERKLRAVSVLLLVAVAVWWSDSSVLGAPAETTELKLMSFAPADHLMNKDVFVPWGKMVEERTGGRVKVILYPGELLGKAKDSYDATVAGTADLSWVYMNATPGRFPLHSVYELPFLFSNVKVGNRVIWENFQEEPALKAEFRDVKVLWLHVIPLMQIHTGKKPIKTLDDLKGMKMRTPLGVASKVIKALGAVPVIMNVSDAYAALERGTVDGTVVPWSSVFSFKFDEVTKYHTEVNLWSSPHFFIMNSRKWNSLPPDIQKAIDSLSGKWGADFTGTVDDKYDVEAFQKLKALPGHEMMKLSPEDIEKGKKLLKPVWEEWVSEREAKGLPAKKILEETLRLGEKLSK